MQKICMVLLNLIKISKLKVIITIRWYLDHGVTGIGQEILKDKLLGTYILETISLKITKEILKLNSLIIS